MSRPGSNPLTSGQRIFAARVAARTGMNPRVIAAWMLAEESGSAAAARERAGNHNWLNIGWTDSGQRGTSGRQWMNPVTAADATAAWLTGTYSVPGFGRAASGVRAILRTAGQPATAQIRALQASGWASSGYPDLPALYRMVGGVRFDPTYATAPTTALPGPAPASSASGGALADDLLHGLVTGGLVITGAVVAGLGLRMMLRPATAGRAR